MPTSARGLTLDNIKWALTAVVVSNWMPVTLLSHIVDCEFFGLQSGLHHHMNILLHALTAVLLFVVLRRATKALWPAAFVAFVFALHPLHVESVAWISERKDVLSTFFWILALYAYVRYAEQPTVRRYLLMVVPFCLGLMSKPMLVTFPFTLLLFDIWPLHRTQSPKTLIEKVPLFVLSVAGSAVTYLAQQTTGAVQSLSLGARIANALVSYVSYIGQMFWPAGLAVFYPYRPTLPAWQVGGAAVVLLGVSVLAVIAWRTRPYLATGWFWYLGTMVPVIGLVQVGFQSHADRYMYVPMIGLTVILAWGAADLVRKWPRARLSIASVAVISCLACLLVASAQTDYWRNAETLYKHAISVADTYVAELNLGGYLIDLPGRGPEAVTHLHAALRMNPNLPAAHSAIGVYFLKAGRDSEAIPQFEAALQASPDLTDAHFGLGLAFAKIPDRLPDAITHFESALRAAPESAILHKNLGMLLLKVNRQAEAISHLQAAQRISQDPEVARILEHP
jgi:hypothetical protein